MKQRFYIDPEPFSVAVGIAGTLGGLASAVSLYRDFTRVSFRKSHRRALAALQKAAEALNDIEEHLHRIEQLVADALPQGTSPEWFGQRVVMVPIDFREYARLAETILLRLRDLMKATHQLERQTSLLPYVPTNRTRDIVDLQLKIEEVLRNAGASPTEVIGQVSTVVASAHLVVNDLHHELGGEKVAEP